MPKPASLVETKGWNRRVRTNSARHAAAAVDHLDRDVAAAFEAADLDRHRPAALASIAFWTRWPSACSSPAGSAMATRPALAERRAPDGRGAWPRRAPRAAAAISTARGGSALARRAGREPGEQVVHLADRALQGRDHVGAEFGIVGVALGVARDQAELAHQILDVVHDEGEAAVELVEALGVGERLLAARLGDIGRGLDAGGAEQVEILPVERAAEGRMLEDDEAGEPAVMDQRNAGPGARRARRARPAPAIRASPATSQPSRIASKSSDEAALLDMAEQRLGAVARGRQRRRSSSSAPAGRQPAMLVGEQQQAGRARRRCRRAPSPPAPRAARSPRSRGRPCR